MVSGAPLCSCAVPDCSFIGVLFWHTSRSFHITAFFLLCVDGCAQSRACFAVVVAFPKATALLKGREELVGVVAVSLALFRAQHYFTRFLAAFRFSSCNVFWADSLGFFMFQMHLLVAYFFTFAIKQYFPPSSGGTSDDSLIRTPFGGVIVFINFSTVVGAVVSRSASLECLSEF